MGAFLSGRPLPPEEMGALEEGRQSSFSQPKNVVPLLTSGMYRKSSHQKNNHMLCLEGCSKQRALGKSCLLFIVGGASSLGSIG